MAEFFKMKHEELFPQVLLVVGRRPPSVNHGQSRLDHYAERLRWYVLLEQTLDDLGVLENNRGLYDDPIYNFISWYDKQERDNAAHDR